MTQPITGVGHGTLIPLVGEVTETIPSNSVPQFPQAVGTNRDRPFGTALFDPTARFQGVDPLRFPGEDGPSSPFGPLPPRT